MGVDKRDYMRESRDPGIRGRWAVASVGTKIIVLNVIVFLLWQFLPSRAFMRENFLVSWDGVFREGHAWTLVTAAFSHEGFWHILWNMLYLHWFGPDLEQIYGRRNFWLLYLYAAVASSLAHCAWSHGWGAGEPALGASGAVMAIVIVSAIFFPHRKMAIWFLIPLPMWFLAGVFVLGDLSGLASPDGIGHAAHLGGALAGAVFWALDLRLFASPGELESESSWSVGGFLRGLFKRKPKPRGEIIKIDPMSERVDELLRKITREGMASLNEEELGFLREASKRPPAR